MMVLGPSHWHVNKQVLHSTYLLQIRLLFRLGQELLMCFPGNQSSQNLEISRFINSCEIGCTWKAACTVRVLCGASKFTISPRNGHNNSLPLCQQCQTFVCLLFNVINTCDWFFKIGTASQCQCQCGLPLASGFAARLQVELALSPSQSAKLFFNTYFLGRCWSIALPCLLSSDKPINENVSSSFSADTNIVIPHLIFAFLYTCMQAIYISCQNDTKYLIGNWGESQCQPWVKVATKRDMYHLSCQSMHLFFCG